MTLRATAGFTMVELCVSVVLLALIGLGVSQLMRLPGPILERNTRQADLQRQLTRLDRILSADLQGADSASIDWTLLPSTARIRFQIAHFDFTAGTGLPATQIEYTFRPSADPSWGSLVRIDNGAETLLLDKIDTPADAVPLFDKDPNMPQILIVNLTCHWAGLREPWTRRMVVKL